MKKILLIKGYGRPMSITEKICENALSGVKDKFEIAQFDAFKTPFAFCNGCNYCEKKGKCVHSDLDDFFEIFEDADVVIFASPVYNGSFSAPVKALIDRFQPYYTWFYANKKTSKTKKHRRGVIVASAGRDGKTALKDMENVLKCTFSIMNMSLYSSVLCPFTDGEPNPSQAEKELKTILENLSKN